MGPLMKSMPGIWRVVMSRPSQSVILRTVSGGVIGQGVGQGAYIAS
jgi:hypothetical protein